MPDFNKILSWGQQSDFINTVIETSKGSSLKIEYRKDLGIFELDRVEPAVFTKPVSYGFIPQTRDEDGDELDTLVVCDEPLPMGLLVKAKVIGVLNFEDDGEMDHKIICVPHDDRTTGDAINSLDDLDDQWKKMVEFHFNHYKDLKKPGSTKVLGWGDAGEAWSVIAECVQAFQKL